MAMLPSAEGYSASNEALAALQDQNRRREFNERREEARDVRHVWCGEFGHLVDRELLQRFHPDTYVKLKLDQGVSTAENLVHDLVEQLAVGWSEGSEQVLLDPDGNPVSSPALQRFLDVLDLDPLMEELERLGWLYRGLFIMPQVVEDELTGRRAFEWAIHTPETFDLLADEDSPRRWCEVVLYGTYNCKGVTRQTATIIGKEGWIKLGEFSDGRWENLGSDGNVFLTVPGIFYRGLPSKRQLWGEAWGGRLAERTIEVNAWLTYQKLLAAGYLKTLAGDFKEGDFPSGQYTRHGAVLKTGSAGEMQLLDYTTDLAAFNAAQVQDPMVRSYVSVGLAAESFRQGNVAESGAALRMRNHNRDRGAVKRRPFLKACAEDLFRMAWWVLYVELTRKNPDGTALPPIDGLLTLPNGQQVLPPYAPPVQGVDPVPKGREYRFVVNPREISYPEAEADRQAKLLFDIGRGYTNDVEEMMRLDPDLTAEQALDKVKSNKGITATLANGAKLRMEQILKDRGSKLVEDAASAADPNEPTTPAADAQEDVPEGSVTPNG